SAAHHGKQRHSPDGNLEPQARAGWGPLPSRYTHRSPRSQRRNAWRLLVPYQQSDIVVGVIGMLGVPRFVCVRNREFIQLRTVLSWSVLPFRERRPAMDQRLPYSTDPQGTSGASVRSIDPRAPLLVYVPPR